MSPAAPIVGVRVLGVPVDVRVPGSSEQLRDELVAVVRERWHLCLREDPPPGAAPKVVEATLLAPGQRPGSQPWSREAATVQDSDVRRLLQRLTQTITHTAIAARTGELLMLHAAGLAHPRTGATAVFVAPGNTGKTTLCLTLGPRRAYVSDETVGIRRDGGVEPFPKPLSVRRPDVVGVKDETAPGSVGLRPPDAPPWLAGIVLLRRDAAHEGEPAVRELDLLEAILALTPESSGFMRTDGPLRWLADVLRTTGGAREVTYGEVAGLEPLAEEIWSRRSPW